MASTSPPSQANGPDLLAPELRCMIAEALDATSLGHLRLASKRTDAAFKGELFARIDKSQSFDLLPRGIDRLASLSEQPELLSHVHTIRLVCPFFNTVSNRYPHDQTNLSHLYITPSGQPESHLNPRGRLQNPATVKWLNEAQAVQMGMDGESLSASLARILRSIGSFTEIALEAEVVQTPEIRAPPDEVKSLPWRGLWAYALQSFRIFLSAVSQSGIQLDSLVIFESTNICSVPLDMAASAFSRARGEGFERVASSLKNFSISLSTLPHEVENDFKSTVARDTVAQDGNTVYTIWSRWSTPLCSPPDRSGPAPGPYWLSNFYTSLQAPPAAFSSPASAAAGGWACSIEGLQEQFDEMPDSSTSRRADSSGRECAAFIHAMKNLEALRVHLYDLYQYREGPWPYLTLLKHILRPAMFQKLESLALHHLPATSALGSDIRASCPQLRNLDLQYMDLLHTRHGMDWCQVLLPLSASLHGRSIHIHLLDLFCRPAAWDSPLSYARSTARQIKSERPDVVRLIIDDEDTKEAESDLNANAGGLLFVEVHPDSAVGFENSVMGPAALHLSVVKKRRIGPLN